MISIVIPIYNAEEYLKECLASIKDQSYQEFEVICVNDGSVDGSAKICDYFVKTDKRFRLINQNNGGVSKARNTALDNVSGEYLCFVDADDVLHQEHLRNLLTLISESDLAVTGYTRTINDLGKDATSTVNYIARDFIYKIEGETIKHPQLWSMLYRTSVVNENNIRFTEGCVRNEDTEFYIKYMANIETVNTNDRITYYYRDTEGSAIHLYNEKSLTFIEADRRISDYLVERGIYPAENYIMASSIQYFTFKCAQQSNKKIYDLVHNSYDVRNAMKKMLRFPRKVRVAVAVAYLLLGKRLFYGIMKLI